MNKIMDEMIDKFEIEAEQELLQDARSEKDQLITAAILVLKAPNKTTRIVTYDVEYGDDQGTKFIRETKKSMEDHCLLKENEFLDIIVGSINLGSLNTFSTQLQ